MTAFVITKDGQARGVYATDNLAFAALLRMQGNSVQHATTYEGWAIVALPEGAETMKEMSNQARAYRAERILVAYNRENNGGDDELRTSAVDLLADLAHLAELEDWGFEAMVDSATMHFTEELEEEAEEARAQALIDNAENEAIYGRREE